MTDSTETQQIPRKPKSMAMIIIDFFSSLGLATVLLLLIGVLTWLATLEQIENGLHLTLLKYFNWKSWYVLPELEWLPKINGNPITFPLPGGYWVCALLLLNLTLGGIIRLKKDWKRVGILIAHFGIILMVGSGGVTQWREERGNMPVHEGESSNVANDYKEYVVEVAEIKTDKPEDIHVIRGEHLTDLEGNKTRIFKLPDMPFDLEIGGYMPNAVPISTEVRAPMGEAVIDGYFLADQPNKLAGKVVEEEQKMAACHARVLYRDGKKGEPFLLAGASFEPFSLRIDNRVFTVDMRKRLWAMPFTVRLDKFTAEFHPNTKQPRRFVSEITRIENGQEAKIKIQMNEPMRYKGLTFFQASYGPQGAGPGTRLYSVFEVVSNPADQWPKYSLFVVGAGLLIQFVLKLILFLIGSSKKKRNA